MLGMPNTQGAPMDQQPHPADAFDVFHGGAGSHPARQAWLLDQLEEWFAGDLADERDRRRIVRDSLRAATVDAHRWLEARFECDDLVRVDLQLEGGRGCRH